jgi:NAD(P)-dependent dehydrogenase (short-subunit alcohol dehydrogenase family)
VAALRARIEAESGGRLDVLVDDAWGGDHLVQHGVPLWESDLDKVLRAVRNGLDSHLVTLHGLLPLLVAGSPERRGLVVEVTDGDDDRYHGPALPYHLVKGGIRRIAAALAGELREHGVTALAVTPGFLRSEAMLDGFGVTEANWRDAIAQDPHYALAESPRYLGRAVAALAADPDVARFAGQCLASWTLMREYGFTDVDGSAPDWGRWFADVIDGGRDPAEVDAAEYR